MHFDLTWKWLSIHIWKLSFVAKQQHWIIRICMPKGAKPYLEVSPPTSMTTATIATILIIDSLHFKIKRARGRTENAPARHAAAQKGSLIVIIVIIKVIALQQQQWQRQPARNWQTYGRWVCMCARETRLATVAGARRLATRWRYRYFFWRCAIGITKILGRQMAFRTTSRNV